MKNGTPAPFVLACMWCTGTISSGGFSFFHQAPLKELILRLRRTTITCMLSLITIWALNPMLEFSKGTTKVLCF